VRTHPRHFALLRPAGGSSEYNHVDMAQDRFLSDSLQYLNAIVFRKMQIQNNNARMLDPENGSLGMDKFQRPLTVVNKFDFNVRVLLLQS